MIFQKVKRHCIKKETWYLFMTIFTNHHFLKLLHFPLMSDCFEITHQNSIPFILVLTIQIPKFKIIITFGITTKMTNLLITINRPNGPIQIMFPYEPNHFLPIYWITSSPKFTHPKRGATILTCVFNKSLHPSQSSVKFIIRQIWYYRNTIIDMSLIYKFRLEI